eukprot:m.33076 g.33076  ORF g.33076 m.33076 type:complete len:334 (-) comp8485_c0_seq1:1235-2236(-)
MAAVLKAVKLRTPADLVQKTTENLKKYDPKHPKSCEETRKLLEATKDFLYGTGGGETSEQQIGALATAAYQHNLLSVFVEKIEIVPFEEKKCIVQIFNKLLRREVSGRFLTVEDVCKKPEILSTLVHGYDEGKKQIDALNSGLMLRECIKQEPLAKVIINDESLFDKFFDYVQKSTFDVAADAFSTFKDLLTSHKILCADFLEKNYDRVFGKYKNLLGSENYVTRRQSLKLLGELLLDRANFTIMTRYISDPENLKLMMNMLRDPSKNIQFEAFHVFKVFVANPNKTKPIMDILLKNKDKLVAFLTKFHENRAEDEQFSDEKTYLIKQIRDLC